MWLEADLMSFGICKYFKEKLDYELYGIIDIGNFLKTIEVSNLYERQNNFLARFTFVVLLFSILFTKK